MKIIVPENVGSSLRVLPIDSYEVEIQELYMGESKQKLPKVVVKYIVQSEYSGTKDKDFQTCIGETVLETISLTEQAMWNLNDLYKGATGERIPKGDFDPTEFETMLKEALIGARYTVLVELDTSQGDERTKIKKRTPIKSADKSSAPGAGAKKVVRR